MNKSLDAALVVTLFPPFFLAVGKVVERKDIFQT